MSSSDTNPYNHPMADIPPPAYQSTVTLPAIPSYESSTNVNTTSTRSKSTKQSDQKSDFRQLVDTKADRISHSPPPEEIWSIVLPFLPHSTILKLSLTSKNLYKLLTPSLWKEYVIRSDDQLWYILDLLEKQDVSQPSISLANRFNEVVSSLGFGSLKGKGKGKAKPAIQTSFLSEPRRVDCLLGCVKTVIFDTIPSPALCASIPVYLSDIGLDIQAPAQVQAQAQHERNEDTDSQSQWIVLFPQATNVQLSLKATTLALKYGWKPFQWNTPSLSPKLQNTTPPRESQLPFAHLLNPINLCIVVPDIFDGHPRKLRCDQVFGLDQTFWNTLKEIHIHGLIEAGTPFLRNRKHFIYLQKELFRYSSQVIKQNPKARHDNSYLAIDGFKERPISTRSLADSLISSFQKGILNESKSVGYPDERKIKEGWKHDPNFTKWVVRYPSIGEEVMDQVEKDIINNASKEELFKGSVVHAPMDEERGLHGEKEKKLKLSFVDFIEGQEDCCPVCDRESLVSCTLT
ncbi:uncharacterized protein IL334_004216 [Kwoniella shivajii]|uniref:F-box domain-containing protein n=1 Tax=Kwoniella shivajii TaxID=564305 RepID=A0ABZ1D1L9_9TREE|nr:hypothetical protein IL334_004216 [Kwoniella shivajii]